VDGRYWQQHKVDSNLRTFGRGGHILKRVLGNRAAVSSEATLSKGSSPKGPGSEMSFQSISSFRTQRHMSLSLTTSATANVVAAVLVAPILQAGRVSDYEIELSNKDNYLILFSLQPANSDSCNVRFYNVLV